MLKLFHHPFPSRLGSSQIHNILLGMFQLNRNFEIVVNDIMSSLEADRSLSPNGISPMPEGLRLPEIIITRRTRTQSMNGRIGDEVHDGTVKFFCRSRGHGFIDDDLVSGQ